jgi:elongation factor Ts
MSKVEAIKNLREITGMGLSECRKALNASNWDTNEAIEYLKTHARESNKPTESGAIFTYVHHNYQLGAILELHCGTDFAARSDDFQKLGNLLVIHVAALDPKSVEEFLAQKMLNTETDMTLGAYVKAVSARFGEPVKIFRFKRYLIGTSDEC